MNDDFLYELRTPPPPEFAARLKTRLEIQASETRQRRRSIEWFLLGAILMGGTALAFVSPGTRQQVVAWIMQFRAPTDSDAHEVDRKTPARSAAISSDALPERSEAFEASGAATTRDSAARAEDAIASTSIEPSVESMTAPASGSGTDRASLAASTAQRAVVRMRYPQALKSLAENLAAALQDRLSRVDVVASAMPSNADLCARDTATANTDLVFSDRRLSQDGRVSCGRFDWSTGFVELPFAYGALVIIIHRENTWARSIALADLRKLAEDQPYRPLTTWNEIRTEWPTLPVSLVGTSLQQTEVGRRFAYIAELQRDPAVLAVTNDDRATLRRLESELGSLGYVDFGTWRAVRREQSAWPIVAAVVNAKGEAVERPLRRYKPGATSCRIRFGCM